MDANIVLFPLAAVILFPVAAATSATAIGGCSCEDLLTVGAPVRTRLARAHPRAIARHAHVGAPMNQLVRVETERHFGECRISGLLFVIRRQRNLVGDGLPSGPELQHGAAAHLAS